MTKTWPGKPGVPINADRDGWHWVKIIHGISQPRPRLWWSKIDRWELSDGALISPSEFAERWRYLGLVLTPDETAALQKRCEEAERERDALRRDTSQKVTTDEMVRRLQHLGDWQAADRIEALQKRVAELEGAEASSPTLLQLNVGMVLTDSTGRQAYQEWIYERVLDVPSTLYLPNISAFSEGGQVPDDSNWLYLPIVSR